MKKFSQQKWKYLLKDNIQIDNDFKKNIAVSLKKLDPTNPWIIDKKGRHTNLYALLNDLPELEDELNEIMKPASNTAALCAKWDCGNVRAVNSLSGSLCNYCSISCMKNDRNDYLAKKNTNNINTCQNEMIRHLDADFISEMNRQFETYRNIDLNNRIEILKQKETYSM
jgi:hypothetical protein